MQLQIARDADEAGKASKKEPVNALQDYCTPVHSEPQTILPIA